MPVALRLHRAAQTCLGSLGTGKGSRLVLSLFFKAVLGVARVFHFETLDDLGFAILTGGKKVLSRSTLGGLVRAAPIQGVLKFLHRTRPPLRANDGQTISIDEHAIARFTRKFSIRKGFHTIRNKHMKIEKLFFPFSIGGRKLLSLIVTRGNAGLATLSQRLLVPLRRQARGRVLRVILDAGAAHNHQRLLELADHPRQVTLVRAPRKKAYRKRPGLALRSQGPSKARQTKWSTSHKPAPPSAPMLPAAALAGRMSERLSFASRPVAVKSAGTQFGCSTTRPRRYSIWFGNFAQGSTTSRPIASCFTTLSSILRPQATTKTAPIPSAQGSGAMPSRFTPGARRWRQMPSIA
jgi:hypothetical protein